MDFVPRPCISAGKHKKFSNFDYELMDIFGFKKREFKFKRISFQLFVYYLQFVRAAPASLTAHFVVWPVLKWNLNKEEIFIAHHFPNSQCFVFFFCSAGRKTLTEATFCQWDGCAQSEVKQKHYYRLLISSKRQKCHWWKFLQCLAWRRVFLLGLPLGRLREAISICFLQCYS